MPDLLHGPVAALSTDSVVWLVETGDAAYWSTVRDRLRRTGARIVAPAPGPAGARTSPLPERLPTWLADLVAVVPGQVEIGYAPLGLTDAGRGGPLAELGGAPVLHWHGDTFAIPEGANRLASTPACANQAFALGDRVLGLQFHLESDPARLEQWLIGHSGELVAHGIDPRELRAEARRVGAALADRGRAVLGRWLDGLGG